MIRRWHILLFNSCLSPPFFVWLQDTDRPKMCGFPSVWRLLLLFICLWTAPHAYKLDAFLPSGPHPTFSAHIQLPACCNIPAPQGVWTLSIFSEAEGQQSILCNCFKLSVQVQISLLSVGVGVSRLQRWRVGSRRRQQPCPWVLMVPFFR